MSRLLLSFAFVLMVINGFSQQKPQKFSTKVFMELDYLLYLPDGYESSDEEYPLILFLHGSGERGDSVNLVKVHGPPKIADMEGLDFIVVSPQCKSFDRWQSEIYLQFLSNLLDEVEKEYRVDKDRIYLTGLSMGGYGTWSLAAKYPDRFAAIAPVCGGGVPALAERYKSLPVWVFHGAKDTVVPISRSQEMVDAIRQYNKEIKFTIYPEAGHDSWTETYNNPELYSWFLSHEKQP